MPEASVAEYVTSPFTLVPELIGSPPLVNKLVGFVQSVLKLKTKVKFTEVEPCT